MLSTKLQIIGEQVCRRELKKKRKNRKMLNDWWNEELEREMRATRRAKREYPEARNEERSFKKNVCRN